MSFASSFLYHVSTFFGDFIDWLATLLADPGGLDLPPVVPEEPSMDGVKGHVVRLDKAVTAITLLAARIYVRDLTEIIAKDIQSFKGVAGRVVVALVARKVVLKAIASQLAKAIIVFQKEQNQVLIGRRIVSQWRKIDADVRTNVLFSRNTKKVRKVVSSRHPGKVRRK